jgi:hypothetical protein
VQIKAGDDLQPTIDAIGALGGRVDADDRTRQAIELELRLIKAGAKAERDAAFELEFHTRDRRDFMTIHGLRIDYNGRVASIDHVVISSTLQFWVCESKSVAEVVEINEQGEWSNYYRGRPQGIASPIEQNRRHLSVLKDVLANHSVISVTLRGLPRQPEYRSLVIVSKKGRVDRSAAGSVSGIDTVVKADQVFSRIDAGSDSRSPQTPLWDPEVDDSTLETVARQLAALHSPSRVDWAARFGLPPEPPLRLLEDLPALDSKSPTVPTRPVVIPIGMAARAVCASCRAVVSRAVVDYCRANVALFGGAVYCIACQKRLLSKSLKTPG